jgi:hypothetical protein
MSPFSNYKLSVLELASLHFLIFILLRVLTEIYVFHSEPLILADDTL